MSYSIVLKNGNPSFDHNITPPIEFGEDEYEMALTEVLFPHKHVTVFQPHLIKLAHYDASDKKLDIIGDKHTIPDGSYTLEFLIEEINRTVKKYFNLELRKRSSEDPGYWTGILKSNENLKALSIPELIYEKERNQITFKLAGVFDNAQVFFIDLPKPLLELLGTSEPDYKKFVDIVLEARKALLNDANLIPHQRTVAIKHKIPDFTFVRSVTEIDKIFMIQVNSGNIERENSEATMKRLLRIVPVNDKHFTHHVPKRLDYVKIKGRKLDKINIELTKNGNDVFKTTQGSIFVNLHIRKIVKLPVKIDEDELDELDAETQKILNQLQGNLGVKSNIRE